MRGHAVPQQHGARLLAQRTQGPTDQNAAERMGSGAQGGVGGRKAQPGVGKRGQGRHGDRGGQRAGPRPVRHRDFAVEHAGGETIELIQPQSHSALILDIG